MADTLADADNQQLRVLTSKANDNLWSIAGRRQTYGERLPLGAGREPVGANYNQASAHHRRGGARTLAVLRLARDTQVAVVSRGQTGYLSSISCMKQGGEL